MKRISVTAAILLPALVLAGCNGSSGGGVAPSSVATMASSGSVAGASASADGSSQSGSSFPQTVGDSGTYQDVVERDASFADLINGVRTENGVGSVSYNAKLDDAAQGHADDMLRNNYFSHTSIDGRKLADRVNETGYAWKKVGENIGQGQTSEREVLEGWIGSPSHQANNVDPDFEEFGLGRAGTGSDTRWVLVFGDPAD